MILDAKQLHSSLASPDAPDVFEVRDDDLLYVLKAHLPEERRGAVEACARQAISLED